MNQGRKLTLAFCAGIAGGLLPALVSSRVPAAAAQGAADPTAVAPGFRLTDAAGRTYALLARGDGQSSHLTFFNQNAKPLLELGLDAAGLPELDFLSAKNGPAPRLSLKLVGANQSAALVFRDGKGRTRMLMGLDPNSPDEDPFLAYYDKTMAKKTVFGPR
jgi:hypothetical protein